MTEESNRSVSIERIFSRAFGVTANHPMIVVGTILVFGTLPWIAFFALTAIASGPPANVALIGTTLLILMSLVTQSLVCACVTHVTSAYSQGSRVELADCLSLALKRFFPVIAVSLLFTIALMLGFLLFLIPGVIVAVNWAVAMPVTVEEQTGIFGAFGRSQELTSGAGWRILALFLLILAMMIAIQTACVMLSSLAVNTAAELPLALILGVGGMILIVTLWSTVQASLFVELREWKDGPVDGKLREIFA